MTFNIPVAYAVMIAAGIYLISGGIKNRRSGWQRVRSNTVLDVLFIWAAARTELRRGEPALPATAVQDDTALASQLAALTLAVNANSGVSPTRSSTIENERTTEPVFHN